MPMMMVAPPPAGRLGALSLEDLDEATAVPFCVALVLGRIAWCGLASTVAHMQACAKPRQDGAQQPSAAASTPAGWRLTTPGKRLFRVLRQRSLCQPAAATNAASTIEPTGALALSAQSIISGSLARTISQAVVYPIDTIKTRLQVSSTLPELRSWLSLASTTARRIRVLGAEIQLSNWLCRGPQDVYLGLTGALCGTLPAAAVYFTTSEGCKRLLAKHCPHDDRGHILTHMVSSSAAAFTSAFLKVPVDVLKHRVQAFVYPNMLQAAQQIYQAQGIKGLYCGFGATLVRDVPEMVVQFTVYEQLRHIFCKDSQEQEYLSRLKQHLLCGGTAGAAAAFVTTPLDVLKTSLQSDGLASPAAAISRVLQRRGPLGLFAGLGPRILQSVVASSVFFCCYELAKQEMQKLHMATVSLQPVEDDLASLTVALDA